VQKSQEHLMPNLFKVCFKFFIPFRFYFRIK